MAEFDNSSSTEVSASKIEEFINEKFSEIITANTEKKIRSLSRNMSNEACQENSDEMNIETCYGSVCLALQNKKMGEEIRFLKE